jgi:FG-GAP repeat
VTSPWGLGVLKQSGSSLSNPMIAPNGTRFGGWLLNTADNYLDMVADVDGDGRDEIVVTSPWGIGILELSGSTMTSLMLAPNGTRFEGWLLNTADNQIGIGDQLVRLHVKILTNPTTSIEQMIVATTTSAFEDRSCDQLPAHPPLALPIVFARSPNAILTMACGEWPRS